MRAVVVFSGLYLLLFALHIVFAANDWDFLFRAVATGLVAMSFLCGPVLWFMVKRLNFSGTNPTKQGYILSLPLATGIAYAFTSMEFQFLATMTTLLVTTATHGGWFMFIKAK